MSTSSMSLQRPVTRVNPLLAAYLANLAARPLATKAVTSGILSFLQEVLANHIAGVQMSPSKSHTWYLEAIAAAKINQRAFKMALYGFFISAPMSHLLVGSLQKAFAGRVKLRDRLLQLVVSNVTIAPIQTAVYLSCMAIIGGAKTLQSIKATVKAGFLPMLKIMWISSPLATLFAQRFLAPELWVPFFNLVGFSLGTFFSVKIKTIQLANARKAEKDKKAKDQKEL